MQIAKRCMLVYVGVLFNSDESAKGLLHFSNGNWSALTNANEADFSDEQKSKSSTIKGYQGRYIDSEFYSFSTPKELYKWLSE